MANGLDFSSVMARVARDGLDGAVIDGTPPVAYPFVPEDAAGIDTNPDEVRTVDVSGKDYAIGSWAADLADAADDEPRPIFDAGILVDEPYARPALNALVSDLLANGMGNRLCYTIPGTLVDTETATDRHREAVDEAVSSLGYDATPISTGYAIVADQLKEENFTGLGIGVDRDVTSVALVYYGVPVIVFSLPYGGDWIVEQAAAETEHDESEVAATLEEFTLDPDATNESVESALAQTYDDLCASLVTALRREAEAAEIERGLAVPVALAGSAAVDGVEYLFGGRFDAADLPFSIRGVRRASEPEESAVRGALISAQEDVDAYEDVTWSVHESDNEESAPTPGTFSDDTASGEAADFQIDAPADDDVADGAIEELFDRLGTRDDELDELRSDVADLSETLDTLQIDLDELESTSATTEGLDGAVSRLDNLESTLQDIDETLSTVATAARVDSLASDVDELDDTVETITDRVETVDADREADRTELQSSIESVESDIETVEDQVETELEALESTVEQLDTDLREATEKISTRIDDDVSNLETAIDDLEHDLAGEADDILEAFRTIESDVDSLEASVESVEPAIDGLETTVESLASDVDAIEETIAANESAIDAIEPSVAANETTIESVESTLETVAADVESLEETVDSSIEPAHDGQLRADLEAVQESVTRLEDDLIAQIDVCQRSTEEVADTSDTLETIVSKIEDELATIAGDLEAVREEHGNRLDEQATLVEELAESTDRLDSLESAVADLETSGSVTAETSDASSLAEVESTVAKTSATQVTLEERVSELEALEERVSNLETTEPGSIPEKPLERIADLDQRVHKLTERVDDRLTAEPDQQSDDESAANAGTATVGTGLGTLLAGGASAAVVTGATVAATGPIEIAAGLLAVGAIGTSVVLVRR